MRGLKLRYTGMNSVERVMRLQNRLKLHIHIMALKLNLVKRWSFDPKREETHFAKHCLVSLNKISQLERNLWYDTLLSLQLDSTFYFSRIFSEESAVSCIFDLTFAYIKIWVHVLTLVSSISAISSKIWLFSSHSLRLSNSTSIQLSTSNHGTSF